MESLRSSLKRDANRPRRMGATLALCEKRRDELGSDGISFGSRKWSQGISSISGGLYGYKMREKLTMEGPILLSKDAISQARILPTQTP